MKIALTSDHHFFQYAQFARRLPTGINSRLQEMLDVEDAAAALRTALQVNLHIRGGDLWDRKNIIDAVTFSEVFSRLLKTPAIPEWILKGNHDLAAGGARNTLESLSSMPHISVQTLPMVRCLDTADIALIPHHDDVEQQRLAIDYASQQVRDSPRCRILVLHGQIVGARSGSEFVLPGSLSLDDLHLDAWDFVFAGHVHEPQQLTENCWYIGSQCQRSFADQGAQRRMFVLDTVTRELTSHALPGPRFIGVRINSVYDVHALNPDPDTYYRIGINTPQVSTDDVTAHMAGKCRGVTFSHGVWTPQIAPRLNVDAASSWDDIFTAYVAQTHPPLDYDQLLARGAALREASYES